MAEKKKLSPGKRAALSRRAGKIGTARKRPGIGIPYKYPPRAQ